MKGRFLLSALVCWTDQSPQKTGMHAFEGHRSYVRFRFFLYVTLLLLLSVETGVSPSEPGAKITETN